MLLSWNFPRDLGNTTASVVPTLRPLDVASRMAGIAAPAALLLLLTLATPTPVAAQEQPADEGTAAVICWRGRPLQECRHFPVVEMQGRFVVSSTSRTRHHPELPDIELRAFDHGLEWNLGLMRNVSDDWALGGTFSLGTGSTGVLTGVGGRARRWLSPAASVELEVGARPSGIGERWGSGTLWGPTVGTRLNAGDHGSLFIRWDGVYAPSGTGPRGARVDGGFQQGVLAGVSLGHTWAVAGTAALGGLVLWLVTTVGDF